MSIFKWLTFLTLSVAIVPALQAEPHCPGNIASLRFHLIQRFQIVVPVVINHTGPSDFLLDTGTQLTMLDRSLALELHLKTLGVIHSVGVGAGQKGSFTRIDLLETGSQAVADDVAAVLDLQALRSAGHHIRGIVGGDFLGHFDVLIDYARSLLCLDGTKEMRASVKGVRVNLATPIPEAEGVLSTKLLLIPVHLFYAGERQLILALDSGAQAPFLYDAGQYLDLGLLRSGLVEGHGGDGVKRAFSVLRPQNMQIGSLNFQQISFVMPSGIWQSSSLSHVDGLLPTTFFRCVFISYADRFVVLEPW